MLSVEGNFCCVLECPTHWKQSGKQGTGTALNGLNQKFQGEMQVENEPVKLRNNVMVIWQTKQTHGSSISSATVLERKAFFLVSNQLIAGFGGWNPNFSDYFV